MTTSKSNPIHIKKLFLILGRSRAVARVLNPATSVKIPSKMRLLVVNRAITPPYKIHQLFFLTYQTRNPKIPLAALPPMVYDIAGSHSQYESAKIWNEFRLTHENNREDLVYDRSERKDSTAG